jgi:preprotein translocase subunit Sec63
MAEVKLEYDLNGEKLFYFILPFVVFIFMIITCCLWPKKEEKKTVPAPVYISNATQVNEFDGKWQTIVIKIVLILAWIVFFIVVCRVSPIVDDNEEFDPFMVLN